MHQDPQVREIVNGEGLWERKVRIGTDSEERRNDSAVRRDFGLSRCCPVCLVYLVPDEIDETDQRDQLFARDSRDERGGSGNVQ